MKSHFLGVATIALTVALIGCGKPAAITQASAEKPIEVVQADINIDEIAERYVKISLAFGEIDKNYVDAYTGPAQWREEAIAKHMPLEDQFAEATSIAASLATALPKEGEEARLSQLKKNVQALMGRMRMARGERFDFDDETAILYDAIPPQYNVADFDAALVELEALMPGEGTLGERYEKIREKLYVAPDKVPAVMEASINECRNRTKAHYTLPENESFDLEFVTGKPWSAYNWYQGNNRSLIQVNLDQPFLVTRALDLGCHEGYPGHHVWNLYVENKFIKENGWLEYQVFPLFAPGGLFGEGSANYGIELAFPGESRLAYEQDALYPIAGLNREDGDKLEAVSTVIKKLRHSRTHIGRLYLDGAITREEAVEMTMKYSLATRSRAEQSMDFVDTYRAYIINYTFGQDLVRDYVERHATSEAEKWAVFEELLLTPTTASDLLK